MLPDDGYQYELIEGEVVRMPPASGASGRQELHVGWLIKNYVHEHRQGVVYGPSTGYLLQRSPDTVLSPDVSFIRGDRRPARREEQHFLETMPDLAVEVMSLSDTAPEVARKARRYLTAGVRLIWVVDPRRRTLTEYLPDGQVRVSNAGDIVDGRDVLPGFPVEVATLMGEQRHQPG